MKTKVLLVVSMLLIISGCSCEKRMAKLMFRCPQLFETKKIEAVHITPEVKADTAIVFSAGNADTVYLERDNIIATVIRECDTLRIYILIPADTVYVPVEVDVPKPEIVVEERASFGENLAMFFNRFILVMVVGTVFVVVLYVTLMNIKK
ncbi:hypothetical protein LJC53_02895 [Bacteroidales bacterium OttesenSCG-928-C03]|nr:hypothetical protein [Bacteroidales bacterium OttesenSCG-928-E04]MDL2308515.1 hypothetical protein [Bacteroidales bacterium OttesenSCG-928-C03]